MNNNQWLDRWNRRYKNPEYVYGTAPNLFLKEQILKLKIGKVLFAAEGEGRNAVFSAVNGWNILAFDISKEGQKKARQLAKHHNVNIQLRIDNKTSIFN